MRYGLIRRNACRPSRNPFGLDRFFDGFFDSLSAPLAATAAPGWAPAVDVEQDDEQVIVRADLPGVDPKAIQITVTEGLLTLEGERKEEHKGAEGQTRWTERFEGAFRRSIRLPAEVDETAIEARYNQGVLEVACPLVPEAKPREIKVAVQK